MLSHAIPPKASLWPMLIRIDESLRDEAKARGCPHCDGRLDRADYWRKPRGVPEGEAPEDLDRRLSLCCAAEGCRRRTTPASARFLGRRVYLGVIVVLAAALRQGATPSRMKTLSDAFGVDRRTVERWRAWWLDAFSESAGWRLARARLPHREEPPPRRLVIAFDAHEEPDSQSRLMSFLARVGTALSTNSEGRSRGT